MENEKKWKYEETENGKKRKYEGMKDVHEGQLKRIEEWVESRSGQKLDLREEVWNA